MIQFLICARVSRKTGRRLARRIGDIQGCECPCTMDVPSEPHGRHVRWGSGRKTSDKNCLNQRAAVRLAADKLEALLTIQGSGVATPNLLAEDGFRRFCDIPRIFRKRKRYAASDKPYVVRANEPADLRRAARYDYALEFIETEMEYRVHVFCGSVLLVQEKRPKKDKKPHPCIRTARNGWGLHETVNPFPGEELTGPAVQAVEVLGLDFGAVDILHGKTGLLYVIEVNTAPGLKSARVRRYAKAIVEWDEARQ